MVSFVLILFFSTTSLLYVLYDASMWAAKLSANSHLAEHEDLPNIHIPKNQFNNSSEIWYKGELYDVGSYTLVNDTIIVSVYHDNNEEEIIKAIAACFETNDSYSNDGQVHLCKYRTLIPNSDKVLGTQQDLNFASRGKDLPTFINLNETTVSHHYDVKVPPPKCCC